MTYKLDELIKLAESMEAGAAVAEAKAVEHGKAGELEEKERQLGRAARAKHFAGVSRHFHGVLRRREKSAAFVPPTLADLLAFAQSDEECSGWPADDVKSWWRHFQSNGWKVNGKSPMKDWKSAAQNGAARWRKGTVQPQTQAGRRPQQHVATTKKKSDPDGWKDFLRVIRRDYEEYEFAPGYLKTDFTKRMSSKR